MNLEIERKFLLKKDFIIEKLKIKAKQELRQGYLREDLNLRVRIVNKKEAFLTYKEGSGFVRKEYETKIELDMAQKLYKKSKLFIKKIRYIYKHSDGKIWELDYFPKYKLWLAEIELKSKKEKFEKPDFIGKDVTSDKRYSNRNLATK